MLEATRNHWRIENSCHWVLDVAFREDASRIRKDNSGENFAIVRRIALNLLKSEKSTKLGVANKRLKAAWDNNYLTTILATLFWKIRSFPLRTGETRPIPHTNS